MQNTIFSYIIQTTEMGDGYKMAFLQCLPAVYSLSSIASVKSCQIAMQKYSFLKILTALNRAFSPFKMKSILSIS